MWPRRSDSRAEVFGRYWDGLAGGATAEEAARLRETVDPTLIAATERVRADYRPRRADPAFVARLERDLMHAIAMPRADGGSLGLDSTGVRKPRIPFFGSAGRVDRRQSRTRWAALPQAIAAILIATVIVGGLYLAF